MSSEKRLRPRTNRTRHRALSAAYNKDTHAVTSGILTPATRARLAAIYTLYDAAVRQVAHKKYDMAVLTVRKSGYTATLKMVSSQFIQVFNFGVDRGVFKKSDRALYCLDIDVPAVPPMLNEGSLKMICSDLISGEIIRTAAGGKPMAMPDIAELSDAYTNFNDILIPHSSAKDAYNKAQEDLNKLNKEADKVIKKVWDEVETYYNEQGPGSQRASAREWGVIYSLTGSNKKVTGIVTDADTGLPIGGVKVYFENGNKKVTTRADGSYATGTALMKDQALVATHSLYNDYNEVVTLTENQNLVKNIIMKRLG